MPWRVVLARALPEFRLYVKFVDGTEGTVNLSTLILSPDAGVFSSLADATIFDQACVKYGAVTWPGDIDLAPDALYAEIKSEGRRR